MSPNDGTADSNVAAVSVVIRPVDDPPVAVDDTAGTDEDVVRRLSGRRVCVKAGHNYHVEFDPPKREGVCDQDGSRLVQRDDDKPEVIRNRLERYHADTEPLVAYYEGKGLLHRIDGSAPPDEVSEGIRAVLATEQEPSHREST